MRFLTLTTLIAASALGGYLHGAAGQRTAWEQKTMGDLCAEGRLWACEVNPICTMNSLYCFPAIDGLSND